MDGWALALLRIVCCALCVCVCVMCIYTLDLAWLELEHCVVHQTERERERHLPVLFVFTLLFSWLLACWRGGLEPWTGLGRSKVDSVVLGVGRDGEREDGG
jgi:hypothetical protein